MTIQAMEKAIENLEYKVAKLEFEVYEQRRAIGQLIIEKADRKTEPQTDIGTSDTVYSDTAGYVPRVDMTDCSWK